MPDLTLSEVVMCAACAHPIHSSNIDWPGKTAVCGRCSAEYVLEGHLFPRSLADHETRMFALRASAPAGTSIRISRRADKVFVKRAGVRGFFDKEFVLRSDVFQTTGLMGPTDDLQVVDVRGFAASQFLLRVDDEPDHVWIQWGSYVLTRSSFVTLYSHESFAEAAHLASELNAALSSMRASAAPYR
ncbi:MAG: hypothetical protein JWO36_1739 [Myxococcales bacterium]|nr:hypothetical protein [Myxococcales bacterium]